MSIINVSDICQFVNESSFEEIKKKSEVVGLCIKEKLIDDKQVFLLANINTNDNFKKNKKNTRAVAVEGVAVEGVSAEGVESVSTGIVESGVVEVIEGAEGVESVSAEVEGVESMEGVEVVSAEGIVESGIVEVVSAGVVEAGFVSEVVESEVVESEVVESEVVESGIEPFASIMPVIDDEKIKAYKKQANGLIFESNTNRVICMCQNRLHDVNNFSEVIDLVQENSNGVRIEYCEDGTILRLYHYNGVWRTATTRCITASSSYWTSDKDFDTMFWETFDKNLLNTMDTNFTYVFILLHRENRIVVKHNVNMLVYVSRINNSTFFEDFSNQFRNVYGIKRPKLMDVDDFRILGSDVNNFDCKFKRGIVIKIFDKTDKTWNLYKYDFERYKMIKSIRGNIPQIRMRYLELLNKPESLVLLEQFYTENTFMFTYIKASILKLVKTVYRLYVDSHIKHTVKVTDENLYYRTLRQLHAQYKLTNKPIGFTDVQQKIYSLDKMVIKKLLGWE